MTQGVLGNDHCAIDDQTEVQRAETHQVGANAPLQHAGGCHQHRHRNDKRGNERGAKVTEQREQNQNDKQGAFAKIGSNGLDRGIHELRAVKDGLDFNAGRQGATYLVNLGIDSSRHRAAVAANQHECGAENDFVAVLAGTAGTDFTADCDRCDIADAHGDRAARADNHLANVCKALKSSPGTNGNAFAVALDDTRTPADVVSLDGTNDVP